MQVPFFIYADNESLLEKIDTCQNDLEKSSTAKVNKNTACSYSSFTKCSFDSHRNKHDYYSRGSNVSNFIGSDKKVAPYQLFVF